MFNKCREYTSHVNGPSIGQVSMSSFEASHPIMLEQMGQMPKLLVSVEKGSMRKVFRSIYGND